jgi:hypothetical protein
LLNKEVEKGIDKCGNGRGRKKREGKENGEATKKEEEWDKARNVIIMKWRVLIYLTIHSIEK